MLKWLKLSQHKHSGHLRPHEHTSYIPLGLLLLIVGFALMAYTAYAATPYTGPESGSIGLSGNMPGKPPTTAAVITVPTDQQHFSISPVIVSGTCPDNTLVEIFKNDIFAGSTPCDDNGSYSIDTDLLIGKNTLTAKVYDALNQSGPDSNPVIVFYDALPSQGSALASLGLDSAQLLLNTDAIFRGIFPNQELSMPIDILGGMPPYAVNIQWGDATNKVISRNNNVSFDAGHQYTKAGTYKVSIQATDSVGRVAFLTVATIVNGQPAVVATTTSTDTSSVSKLLVLWPLYTGATAIVASFFLGERREKRVLRTHGILIPS
jgi:hypothetical protein